MSYILGDRYSIQQQLGKKPGRQTFLALDKEVQDLVVIKLLRFDNDFEWDSLKLFEREAIILQNISHRAIPKYLDFFEVNSPDTKGFALVQSYIDAKSLEEHIQNGRTLSETDVKEIAEKVLDILIFLHDRKPAIVHRDIKPSNILLANRSGNSVGKVYLVDFGSVQNITAVQGGTMTVVGTYGYMSPEHFGGRAVPTSDLYSLGATLIYLLTGIHPADLPQKDLQIQFEDKTQISLSFQRWLKKMVEPSQEKRFVSAKVALQALKEPDKIHFDIAHTTVKPFDSKILLKKDHQKIEIIIPGTGFNLNVLRNAITNIICTFFMLPFFGFLLFPIIGWLLALAVAVGISKLWADSIFNTFGKTRLKINKQKISLTYELFGLKYHKPRPCSREHLLKLERLTHYIVHTKDSQGNISYKSITPTIIIWAGNKQYTLQKITQTELDWLSQELSDTLGLPIHDRSVPVVRYH